MKFHSQQGVGIPENSKSNSYFLNEIRINAAPQTALTGNTSFIELP